MLDQNLTTIATATTLPTTAPSSRKDNLQPAWLYNPELDLAAGWYVATTSKALKAGATKPLPLRLFGLDLIAYRDEQGQAVLMWAYCSHLGASLALGKVSGGCVTCPFHGWQYNGKGECVEAPQLHHALPPTAYQKTYLLVEKYGYLWVWYGSATSLWELPYFPQLEKGWLVRSAFDTTTTPGQVGENPFDPWHFMTLHKMAVEHFELVFSKEEAIPEESLTIEATSKFEVREFPGFFGRLAKKLGLSFKQIDFTATGWPSLQFVQTRLDGEGRQHVLNAFEVRDKGQTVQHLLLSVKRSGKPVNDLFNLMLFGFQSKLNAAQDIPVFDTIRPEYGVALTRYDRAILAYRKLHRNWAAKAQAFK